MMRIGVAPSESHGSCSLTPFPFLTSFDAKGGEVVLSRFSRGFAWVGRNASF